MTCQEAFLKLKDLLATPPVLVNLDFIKGFVLHIDVSTNVLGAVLEQKQDDNRLHPVALASRSLSKAGKKCGITELEEVPAYLYGRRCIVYTNHSLC